MKLKHGKRIIWNSEKANDKRTKPPKMVKKQGKDETIWGDLEELTMHRFNLKHTNENKWLNSTKKMKMNNEKLQEDFFFPKLNEIKISLKNQKETHGNKCACFNGRWKSNREIAEMLLKRCKSNRRLKQTEGKNCWEGHLSQFLSAFWS